MRAACITLLLVLSCGCKNDSIEQGRSEGPSKDQIAELARELLPSDAFEVKEEPNAPWVQLSFHVQRAPEQFAIAEERFQRAATEGWLLCEPPTQAWNSYPDAREDPPVYTQQRTYELYRDGVLLTVIGSFHYESEQAAEEVKREQKHKPVQEVYVVGTRSTLQNANREADGKALVCRPKSP